MSGLPRVLINVLLSRIPRAFIQAFGNTRISRRRKRAKIYDYGTTVVVVAVILTLQTPAAPGARAALVTAPNQRRRLLRLHFLLLPLRARKCCQVFSFSLWWKQGRGGRRFSCWQPTAPETHILLILLGQKTERERQRERQGKVLGGRRFLSWILFHSFFSPFFPFVLVRWLQQQQRKKDEEALLLKSLV